MRHFRTGRRRSFQFESLESRRVMAGNIDASFNGFSGILDLGGDGAANAVEVAGNGNPGEVIVTPLVDAATGVQTQLEGAAVPILYTGVTGFSSGLGAGNDELYIRDFVFSTGDIMIRGQAGADTIHIGKKVSYGTFGTGDVFVGGRVSITEAEDVSNSDADSILLGRLTIQEELDIYGDLGDDFIDLYNVSVNGNITHGGNTVLIHGEEGSDVYNIAYLNCVGGMQLTADTLTVGNDLISFITSSVYGRAYFDVWHGTNTVAINACNFYDKVEIYTETGADTIRLTNSIVSLQVVMSSFYSSNNNDSITVQGCIIQGHLTIIAAAGYDTITILGNNLATAYISAGADSDAMIVRYNIFSGYAQLLGGAGFDALYMSGNLFNAGYTHDFVYPEPIYP